MDADGLATELQKLAIEKDLNAIKHVLQKMSTEENQTTVTLKDTFLELLNHNDSEIHILVAKNIAELTKIPERRTQFSDKDILLKLINILKSSITNCNDSTTNIALIIQLCRALGNIFYSNDEARSIIFNHDGGKVLVDLFDVANSEVTSSDDLKLFAKVRSGVASNYLLGNEELSQKAIQLNIIDKLRARTEECLNGTYINDDILEQLLPLFSILTEQVSDLIFPSAILIIMTKILKNCTNSDVVESCLELLQYQAESDDVKLLLAKEGVCENIFESIEKYKEFVGNVEARSLVKMSCDLIVLILTGDDAMHFLDETPLLSYMQKWLDTNDVDLMTTSVLAMGNFARTDNHCIRMVQDNIMFKLIEILAKNNGPDSDVRLQHALLSAIRNLVIPKENKIAVIEAGLVDTILPMLQIHQPPVVFKLLGTLRMLIDGQDELALKLLQNEILIIQLVEWAQKTPDMVGVNSESSRLMAWLIKNGYRLRAESADIMPLKSFIKIDGTADTITKMLLSAHLVMQNEALIALTIMSMLLGDREQEAELGRILIEANLGEALTEFMQRISEMERTSNEIVENLNTLVVALKRSDIIRKHLEEHEIDEKLNHVPRIQQLCTL